MIHGIGVDLLLIDHMLGLIERCGQGFLDRTFTTREREAAASRTDPVLYFCTRFAAKEAAFKALRPPADSGCDLREAEVLNDGAGRPYVVLHGHLQKLAAESGISALHISISDDEGYVIAFATAEVEG